MAELQLSIGDHCRVQLALQRVFDRDKLAGRSKVKLCGTERLGCQGQNAAAESPAVLLPPDSCSADLSLHGGAAPLASRVARPEPPRPIEASSRPSPSTGLSGRVMDGAEWPRSRRRPRPARLPPAAQPALVRSAVLLAAALLLLLGPTPAACACTPPAVQAASEQQCSQFCSQRAPAGFEAQSQLSPRAYRRAQTLLHVVSAAAWMLVILECESQLACF